MTTTSLPRSYRGADAAAPKSVLGGIAAADVPDEAVVFLIGMRINRLRRLRSWVMPVRAMTRMLVDLAQQEDSPLLHARTWWSGRNVLVVQYWRSAEELGRYATDPDHPHAAAWREFNRRLAASADVGIWHETYAVGADQVETLYGNMPPFGLAAAYGVVPATRRRSTAAAARVHGAAGDQEFGRTE